jgi:hypothetical protein
MIHQMTEINSAGGGLDVLTGEDVDPDTRRLLSIAQLQEKLRARGRAVQTPAATPIALLRRSGLTDPPRQSHPHRSSTAPAVPAASEAPVGALTPAGGRGHVPGSSRSTAAPRDWLLVIGAHAGAGSSSIALAMADSAALTGRTVHLIEAMQARTPTGAGLAAVTHHELGLVAGGWRRGRRGRATVDRPDTMERFVWPPPPPPGETPEIPVTILDAGTTWMRDASDENALTARRALPMTAPAGVVIVCRANVPGVISAERTLLHLDERSGDLGGLTPSVVVAAVGGRRWRGAVKAAAGPALARLQEQHLVVGVPHLRRLEITGPTSEALPRALTAAGRSLLVLAAPSAPTSAGGPR